MRGITELRTFMDFHEGKLYFSLNYDLTSAEADLNLLAWSAFKLFIIIVSCCLLCLFVCVSAKTHIYCKNVR